MFEDYYGEDVRDDYYEFDDYYDDVYEDHHEYPDYSDYGDLGEEDYYDE